MRKSLETTWGRPLRAALSIAIFALVARAAVPAEPFDFLLSADIPLEEVNRCSRALSKARLAMLGVTNRAIRWAGAEPSPALWHLYLTFAAQADYPPEGGVFTLLDTFEKVIYLARQLAAQRGSPWGYDRKTLTYGYDAPVVKGLPPLRVRLRPSTPEAIEVLREGLTPIPREAARLTLRGQQRVYRSNIVDGTSDRVYISPDHARTQVARVLNLHKDVALEAHLMHSNPFPSYYVVYDGPGGQRGFVSASRVSVDDVIAYWAFRHAFPELRFSFSVIDSAGATHELYPTQTSPASADASP